VSSSDGRRRHRVASSGFSVAGPTVCNSLPKDMWDPEYRADSFRQVTED